MRTREQKLPDPEPRSRQPPLLTRSLLLTGRGIRPCLYSVKKLFYNSFLCSLQLFAYVTTNPLRENSRVSVQGSSQPPRLSGDVSRIKNLEDRKRTGGGGVCLPLCRKLGTLRWEGPDVLVPSDSFQKVSPRLLGNEFYVRPLSPCLPLSFPPSPSLCLFPSPSSYDASKNNFKLPIFWFFCLYLPIVPWRLALYDQFLNSQFP